MTVNQCRGGPFLPVSQVPSGFKAHFFDFSNQWGKCTVRDCHLTEIHQDILDAIIVNSRLTKISPDGRILVVFSPYQILKTIGHKQKNNHHWLDEKLDDMRKVRVDTELNGWRITSGILNDHAKSLIENEEARKRGGFAGDSKYWYIIIDNKYAKFFIHDMKLHYQALLPEILSMKHAVTKKLVRFCLSHDRVNMTLDDILIAIGAFDRVKKEDEEEPGQITIVTPLRTQRQIRKKVRDEAEALERDFGIEIRKMEDGREGVFYQKHPKVWFESPEKSVLPCSPVIDAPKAETAQGAAMV